MAVVLNKPMPTKNPRVVVYLSADLKADLEALAEVENRSVSNLLETVVKEMVDKAKKDGKLQK